MEKINPSAALFIKLGSKGKWEKECIENGVLRIGFNEFTHEDLLNHKYEKVREVYRKRGTSKQWITIYENQIRSFYEADETVLWITFYSQKLWWCFAKNEFKGEGFDKKYRITKSGWSCKDIEGNELLVDNLSGELLKTQGFQSTICNVAAFDYLINKINAIESEYIVEVKKDVKSLIKSVGKLIQKLQPKDFELLIDLIFRQAGFQRTNMIGGPQKTKDIELISQVTHERILVQVKSSSHLKLYQEYEEYFSDLTAYDRFYYVVHSPGEKLKNYKPINPKINIWTLDKVAKLTIEEGVLNWLIEKVN